MEACWSPNNTGKKSTSAFNIVLTFLLYHRLSCSHCDYVLYFCGSGRAYRQCDASGNWEQVPIINRTWANYTECTTYLTSNHRSQEEVCRSVWCGGWLNVFTGTTVVPKNWKRFKLRCVDTFFPHICVSSKAVGNSSFTFDWCCMFRYCRKVFSY